ncbi:TonB-dependent receptor domain-containing protein [Thaumasiovibrio subtropicus]|uniref:TonB-dependent receptor domain-containing protein n=1 Tax=Thaumasiovibrio subtropicus TaxID=1891207 RepID=UPI000B34D028|nr:TonB-dependent receptor [Thaumasiovibrio subtropicus]
MKHGRSPKISLLALAITGALSSPTLASDEVVTVEAERIQDASIHVDALSLKQRQANELNDIFRTEPDVSVGGGSSVSQKIYVRGLEDNMLNVQIDGATQSGNLYHHQGRLSIEPELLKQVEISAGAGRATDGPGALGGAIRFKTKDPEDLLSGDQRAGALLKAGYFSNTDGVKTSASGYGYLTDNVSALATIIYSDHDDFEDGTGYKQPHTASEHKVGLVKLVADITEEHKLTLSFEQRGDEATRYHRPQWVPSKKNIPFDQEMIRRTYTANFLYEPSHIGGFSLDATLYNTDTTLDHLDGPWGDFGGTAETSGGDVRFTSVVGALKLVYGVDFRRDKGTLSSPVYGVESDKGRVLGNYIQGDFELTNNLLFSVGGRFDTYRLQETTGAEFKHEGFSPNALLQYSFPSNVTAYISYAEAIRGAQVREIFKLDGAKSSPDRKEESAKNSEFGVRWHRGGFNLSAVIFRTDISDVVVEDYSVKPRVLKNDGDLKNVGFSLSSRYRWEDFQLGLSYSQSRPELNGEPLSDDNKGIGTSIGDTWVLDMHYDVIDSLSIGYTGNYVERLTDVAEGYDEKPGYAIHDVYAQWQPLTMDELKVTFTVKNVFDKAYRDHASYAESNAIATGTLQAGRDIRLSASYAF